MVKLNDNGRHLAWLYLSMSPFVTGLLLLRAVSHLLATPILATTRTHENHLLWPS